MSNHDNIDTPMNGGDDGWAGGNRDGGGTPPRRGGSPGARRSSRSRSPKRNGGGDDKPNGSVDGGSNPGNNLHISGLSSRVDSRELEAIFSKVGKVKKASVMYDPHTRDSRGFGFVTMETPEDAEAAITQLNATEHVGKVITVEKARRGRARTPTPGRYYGPPKRPDRGGGGGGRYERPYDPRPYDSRYNERDRERGYGGGGRYEDRRSSRYDERRYDDRRYDDRRYDERRYDERRY